jgi:phospholipase C
MEVILSKASLVAACLLLAATAAVAGEDSMPRYEHIFVIVEENHNFDEIIGNRDAPMINRLAKEYGLASNFYGEVHPSEGNYVAMLGGDSYGIHDDDAYWCKKGDHDRACPNAEASDYVAHTVTARSLIDQLNEKGLKWKGYFQDIPAAGYALERSAGDQARPAGLYAAKHNGFMNFKVVQKDPDRAEKIVSLEQLARDLAADSAPAFAHIVPGQCDDMHGLNEGAPSDCRPANQPGLIGRADAMLARLVQQITASKLWKGPGNSAIVITWDEGGGSNKSGHPEGCCGNEVGNPSNFGGGWIPTIVITNHGPRGVTDPTPYNHYSLLRSIEGAFGMTDYVGHAADSAQGVVMMTPLFAVRN